MDEETRLQARELLLRSKIYRFVALIFAGVGVLIFAWLYFKWFDGDLMEAATSVSTIFIIIIPFLPAFVLSSMAAGAEKKLAKLLGGTEKTNKK